MQASQQTTSTDRKIRVLIVDDHPRVRALIRSLLLEQADIAVVGEAADGDEAVETAGVLMPDIVLMDVKMPKMDGLAATAVICTQCSPVKVLIVTELVEEEYCKRALEAGARGFISKGTIAKDLVIAIHTVKGGGSYIAR